MQAQRMRVGVVGAGIAGLTCARALARRGCEVAVFEKSRGAGGRAATRRAEPFAFDHGAQYFVARDPGFRAEVEAWSAAGVVAPWPVRVPSLERGVVSEAKKHQTRYVGVPGMSAIGRQLASGLPVAFGARVEALRRDARGWRLLAADGDLGHFDALVVATPAEQAAALLEPLASLRERVAGIRMQPCQAALVGLASPLALPFDAAFVADSPLAWVARNPSKPGRALPEAWVLHASAEWSREHLELAPETVAKSLWDAFAAALGRPLPEPAYTAGHRWRFALASEPLGVPSLWDPEARVAACGDWCLGGRLESAYLSGAAAAEQLLGAHAT